MKWKPDKRLVAVLALGALAVMLIPLLRICEYAVPWFDDYGYALYVKDNYAQSCTWLGALRGAWDALTDEWKHWQGTYSGIFFATLCPLIWGEEYYGWGPVFLILLLAVSVFVLMRTFLRTILKGDKWISLILQAGCSGMVVMFIYSAQRGFYWFDGGVFYVAMSSVVLLFVGAQLKLFTVSRRSEMAGWLICSMVLAFIVGGGNYVVTLQGILLSATFLAVALWKKRERIWRFVPVTLVSAIGLSLTVLAPGNSKRGENFVGWGMSPVKAILYSFVDAAEWFWKFTGFRTIAFLLLLAPFMWQLVKKTEFKFQYPGLVALWSVCLYAAAFTPGLYALGDVVLDRMLCSIKITLQLLLFLNEIYVMGWIYQKYTALHSEEEKLPCWWFYPMMALLMLFIFVNESDQAGNYSAYGAYYYIHTGEAFNFYQEYQERLAVLKGEERDVVFEPYVWRPWFLCAGDLSDNPGADRNQMVADWYNKDSVVCKSREE